MSRYVALQPVGSTAGDVAQLIPDKGKGIKRTVIIWVQNALNATAFISKERQQLLETDSSGNICGIPVGKNGAANPLVIPEWQGPMYGVAGGSAPVTVVIEENA